MVNSDLEYETFSFEERDDGFRRERSKSTAADES